MIASVAYRPFEGERRVFVIEVADAMAEESQNALLKTLEEPPGYAHLILVSAEPAALLDTVLSRCQRIDFAPLSATAMERELVHGPAGRVTRAARRAGAARRRRPRPGAHARLPHRGAAARSG